MSRDIFRLPNGNILFSYNDGYNSGRQDNASGVKEVTPKGEVVFHFQTTGHVFSCYDEVRPVIGDVFGEAAGMPEVSGKS